MKIVKILIGAFLALVLLVVIVGFLSPSEYKVVRSVDIEASPEIVHALVGDLAQWDRWTPWKLQDPTIEVSLGDKTTGVGASQTWTGESGTGELAFTESSAQDGIAYDLSFNEGQYVSKGWLRYAISGASTKVDWVMEGEVGWNPLSRIMTRMMDSMVGPSFEQGLERLKSVAEDEARLAVEATEAEAGAIESALEAATE